MYVPWYALYSAEAYENWVADCCEIDRKGAALALSDELWEDVQAGRSTLTECTIDGHVVP